MVFQQAFCPTKKAKRDLLQDTQRSNVRQSYTYVLCCCLMQATAAGAAAGPFFASSAQPLTPAAAAAAGALLSPRAALDRRGSALLDAAAPGTASRVAGSGWGHWAPNGAEAAAAAAGDFGAGPGAAAAAAAAGGTAADKRGAGLGQELITPLQVDPSIDFDQVKFACVNAIHVGVSTVQQ
jgi:hypothetical protein